MITQWIFFPLKAVAYSFRVTMDTKEDHAMLVCYRNNKAYHFKESGKGLYYLNVSNQKITTLKTDRGNSNYYLLSTMNANIDYFPRADIEG